MVPTRNDIYHKIEGEVREIAIRYELEFEIYDDVNVDYLERKFNVLFDDPITHAKEIFKVNPIKMGNFRSQVWEWVKEIRGIGGIKKEETVEKPIDPLVEIAKQLRIANELKIIELKHGHGTGYFRENVIADVERIEKEMKGEV